MKPYYQDDKYGITIYHGDCREILPQLAGDSLIGDPPYGIGIDYLSYEDSIDNLASLISGFWPHCGNFRTSLLTCGIANMWMWLQPDWVMSWFIPGNTNSGPWGFCCWVPILAYGADPYLLNGKGRRPDAFIRSAAESQPKHGRIMQAIKRNGGHPTPKPIDAWKWLVNRASLVGETVIDPFMGSGCTLIAAKDLERKAIGIEIEEKYCAIAAKRLEQEVFQF